VADFFEIDFLAVETDKSGDAVPLRYSINGVETIHVVDGGFQGTGEKVAAHIRKYYGNPNHIDHVVVTHNDGDHAGGLRTVLEEFEVGTLWMLRPWIYAESLIGGFATYNSVLHLEGRLRAVYPNLDALEEIAIRRKIPIREPFQGQQIGAFTVLAPSPLRYFQLVFSSERTPEAVESPLQFLESAADKAMRIAKGIRNLVRRLWGVETFSDNETSAENEMSVVQFAQLCGEKILLTGDAGRGALAEAAEFAPAVGLQLPGVDRVQIPHHGSRRNVSTDLLNKWFGPIWAAPAGEGQETFEAYVSAAKADPHHPRNSVLRAFMHRGAAVVRTEGVDVCAHRNGPNRGWPTATRVLYPDEQEED
jgi:hypothetical protein